ncbi:MAG TPA: hypothetical protein VM802_06480 [Chitinophaga sp.]|uniref:hypothetical protein n=1 Tax=Chitinophaga sp. TaxID=1869181 RepID=UPI002C944549|nr:hypothetical protein [Chitinophaga sp.]HVI44494.1 hypothetical protein [Chitinophaga sp.]
MFSLFQKKYNNPALLEKIRETQERWFTFLGKLEARMEEMSTAAIPELRDLFNQDNDPYKRAHGHMLQGLLGQINQMRHKANEAREENIFCFVSAAEATLPAITSNAGQEYHNALYAFRMACSDRYHLFDEKLNHHITLLQKAAGEQDLEAIYREELTIFENIRDKFSCKQCGGNITIPQMFFIATYVNCPFCKTQNTFMPSTGAQLVLHQARSLAEQRTAHLLHAYEESVPKNETLYKQYLRAMFDEWNKIVPDMAGENEKFYQRLLNDHLINKLK